MIMKAGVHLLHVCYSISAGLQNGMVLMSLLQSLTQLIKSWTVIIYFSLESGPLLQCRPGTYDENGTICTVGVYPLALYEHYWWVFHLVVVHHRESFHSIIHRLPFQQSRRTPLTYTPANI